MAPKRKCATFTVAEKVWLLDFSDRNPHLNATELGKSLAQHLNEHIPANVVPRVAPGPSTVNDWRKNAAKLRQLNGNDAAGAVKRQRKVIR